MFELHTHQATRNADDAGGRRRLNSPTWHFIRHYAEMVAAMFLGMAVLGIPAEWAFGAVDTSWGELNRDAPALMLLGMAATMTIPMVAWMRYRGHGWRANAEMAASMVLPTFASIGLVTAGAMDIGALLVGEHVAMLLGMLAAMLLRPDEYAGHHTRTDAAPGLATA